MNSITDSKRFYLGKAVDYSKYRPHYPVQLFELKQEYNLNTNQVIHN